MMPATERVPVRDVKVGDVISGWDVGNLTITDAATGKGRTSFRGRVLEVETERIERSEANGGPYDNPVRFTVENLSRDTVWHVAPFLCVSKVTRELS